MFFIQDMYMFYIYLHKKVKPFRNPYRRIIILLANSHTPLSSAHSPLPHCPLTFFRDIVH